MIKETLRAVEALDARLLSAELPAEEKEALEAERARLLEACRAPSPQDRVYLARYAKRPKITDFISALFTDFFEQRGDRQSREDASILGGIALYRGRPVTVLGHRKGKTVQENLRYNFGMPEPAGYRKALRLMREAEKFGRPILTFIDTPGAYPGKEAEEQGQGEAIARNLAVMSSLRVPVISVVTGEGNSGGALAISVANRILMLENAVYSVLSPEGFASILWKDAARSPEASAMMKLTAADLLAARIVDEVIPEPVGGAQRAPQAVYAALDAALCRQLGQLAALGGEELAAQRYQKFREIGFEG